MLTRLYANNYRCLVGFEIKFDSLAVLCGPNGAGKSSVFDVLRLIQDLGTGNSILGAAGPHYIRQLEFTDWLKSTTQEFEITFEIAGKQFDYHLQLEQLPTDASPRIIYEKALKDGNCLFSRDHADISFSSSDGTTSSFPLDWRQTALSAIQPVGALKEVKILQDALAKLLILRPCALLMEKESRSQTQRPNLLFSDLISWYRSLSQEQEWTDALRSCLQDVWPDFKSFRLIDVGVNSKILQLRFETNHNGSGTTYFHLLSDGEKALVGLYMIRAAMETDAANIVLIDEPDNFVGLPELQPWLLSMRELLDQEHQVILISHHPEILGNAGEEHGIYLGRDNHSSPTRIQVLRTPNGISIGEAMARGWANV